MLKELNHLYVRPNNVANFPREKVMRELLPPGIQ